MARSGKRRSGPVDSIHVGKTYYKSKLYNQVFALSDASDEARGDYLGLLESLSFPVTVKMVVKSVDKEVTSRTIGKYLADRKSEIRYSRNMGDSEKERLQRQIQDLEAMSARIASMKSRLVDSFTSFRVSSRHPVKLRESSRNFSSIMKLMGFFTRPVNYMSSKKLKMMFSPFRSVAIKYPMDTQAISRILPLAFTETPERHGVLLGVDDTTEKPFFLDLFGKTSHNVLIFGETGSGKSFFSKLLLMRLAVTRTADSIMIVDPLGEYFCHMFPGKCREVKVTAEINSMDPDEGEGVASGGDDSTRITIYKISELMDKSSEYSIESLLSHLYKIMTENENERKVFLIDEAHLVIGNKNSLEALSRMVRHSRHYRSSVINVTQNVDDLSRGHFSSVIADNSSSIFIFRSRYLSNTARQRFGLTKFDDSSAEDLMGGKNTPYSECMAIGENRMSRVRILGTEFESGIIEKKGV